MPATPRRGRPYGPSLSEACRAGRSGLKVAKSLVSNLKTSGNGDTRWNHQLAKHLVTTTAPHDAEPGKPWTLNHTIFEGTSEIQQLVIARAISGPPYRVNCRRRCCAASRRSSHDGCHTQA
jgi:hypothetical protein